jgi:cysteine synthase A
VGKPDRQHEGADGQRGAARAEEDGRLKPGYTVVEYTGGSTGAALALVCPAKGYRICIVTSDAFSREKLDQMAALGAELTIVPSEDGPPPRSILDMVEAARAISREPRTFWTDQLNNMDSIAGYRGLGDEIWSQRNGQVDAFVHCVGIACSSRGVAAALKRHRPGIRIVAVGPPSRRCSRAGSRGRTRSKAWESCWAGRGRGRTWSRHSRWRSGSGRNPGWSRKWGIPA